MISLDYVDMHTAGEPVRILTGGGPRPDGDTLLDKRDWFRDHADWVRRMSMWEPRGHFDMYGVIPVEPDRPEADVAVLFIHNSGYSTMCGHATLALARWFVESGRVAGPDVAIQVPAGLVEARFDGARSTYVGTPSFVTGRASTNAAGTEVEATIAFGGAFYALVTAEDLGVDLDDVASVVERASATTTALSGHPTIRHPSDDRMAFLYGTIVTDGGAGSVTPSRNVCVFADRQVDRSPTGSGVQARLAAARAVGSVSIGEPRAFVGPTGVPFVGTIMREIAGSEGGPAVVVEVSGTSHHVGSGTLVREPNDGLEPFLVR